MGRKACTLILLFFTSTLTLQAHPGIGIVMDSRGNVFYTDLTHVWKIAPDGTRTIAVRNVHTHELYLDRHDNLFGEHLWYNGDATKTWGHRVWRLSSDGTLMNIIPPRKGLRERYRDFFFTRDRQGSMYWADRGKVTAIRKRTMDGTTTTIVRNAFHDVRNLTVNPVGMVYLIDLHDLICITADGTMRTLATDLPEQKPNTNGVTDRHAVMGIWLDFAGNVYAAVAATRQVKRISPEGNVHTVARSVPPWSPSGGLVAPDGNLWILEYSDTNAVRVRRIDVEGRSTYFE